jgi:hypothetical protein
VYGSPNPSLFIRSAPIVANASLQLLACPYEPSTLIPLMNACLLSCEIYGVILSFYYARPRPRQLNLLSLNRPISYEDHLVPSRFPPPSSSLQHGITSSTQEMGKKIQKNRAAWQNLALHNISQPSSERISRASNAHPNGLLNSQMSLHHLKSPE